MRPTLLAFLSGIPALVYQVVWTREVALVAGARLDAVGTVVAAFFGGLAIGSRWLGARCETSPRPLALYGRLELAAAALALMALGVLRALAESPIASPPLLLALAAAAIAPASIALGGTQPALVRATGLRGAGAAPAAGRIAGANTLGSVLGVALAVFAIPTLGLQQTTWAAAASSAAIGTLALLLARRRAAVPARPAAAAAPAAGRASPVLLVLAALAGVATLAFEVGATRMASLQLGSSLDAWGLVLVLFLCGLGAGNLVGARIAQRSARPLRALALAEATAALAIVVGLPALHPQLGRASPGVGAASLVDVALGALPPALAMGAAFPLFARVVLTARVGESFGQLAAWNTAGGIVGALLAPALLLPWLGMSGAALACALVSATLAVSLLVADGGRSRGLALAVLVAVGLGGAASHARIARDLPADVLHVEHGRFATAVVRSAAGRRDLIVDGEPEASTGSVARATELQLAALPLVLHPDPQHFLELGFGSGITLGAAARLPLATLACVEIADSVLRSARWFTPDNRDVLHDPRLALHRLDARVFLRVHAPAGGYDAVAANTVHPWSLGATGLYSQGYFRALARVLAAGGVVSQWLPAERISRDEFAAIVRGFLDAFAHGALFWGSDALLLVGSAQPLELPEAEHIDRRLAAAGFDPRELRVASGAQWLRRRVADAATLREMLRDVPPLRDDLPRLERRRGARRGRDPALFEVLAQAAARADADAGMRLWLEAEAARAAGKRERADARERLAIESGLALARRARAERRAARGLENLQRGDLAEARTHYRAALRDDPTSEDALLGLAAVAERAGDGAAAIAGLEALVREHPSHAGAWNQLAGLLHTAGRREQARRAVAAALRANPWFPEALANAGLLAVEAGDAARARAMAERLRALAPNASRAQLERLERARREADAPPTRRTGADQRVGDPGRGTR